ncbi:MAG: prepilin-type N-terminal cleavage/methylation domain-containing protein [Phycisphaerales bacterium]
MKLRGRSRTPARAGFTLLEVVVVVIVLALAVPPALMFADQSSARRADAVNAMRATTLGTLVMESILADVASTRTGLGYAALAASGTYLDTPTTGLRARIASLQAPYAALGMTYAVSIGPEVDSTGTVSGTPANNVFRKVTVTVSYPAATRASADITLAAMVSEL